MLSELDDFEVQETDFICDFAYYLRDKHHIPPRWALKVSCTTFSTVMDTNIWVKTFRGRNLLNVWNVLFAPSGKGKSVPWDEDVMPILIALSKKMDYPFILPSIASSFEGITKRALTKSLRGLIIRDEFTTLFKEAKAGYTATVQETYSKLYDGWILPRATMSTEVEYPIPVYVSQIGGATPKYTYNRMGAQFFFQGCGNRYDYELWEGKDEHRTQEELFPLTNAEDLYK